MILPIINSRLFILTLLIITFFVKNSTCQNNVPTPNPDDAKTPEPTEEPPSVPLILPELKINLGDSCNFELYTAFVSDSKVYSISNALTNPDFKHVDRLKDLCVEVASDSVVDVHKFDCVILKNKSEICSCGYSMYQLDPLWSAPSKVVIKGVTLRTYMKVKGLDRQLHLEKGKCVSGTNGHCTIDDNRADDMKLKCREKHSCKETSFKIQNQNSSEWYYTCEKNLGSHQASKKKKKASTAASIFKNNYGCTFLLVKAVVIAIMNMTRV